MRVVYHPLARVDAAEILEYYELEAGGEIASAFFADLTKSIEFIARSPRSFPLIHNEIRCCLLRRFPYQINYEIVDSQSVKILVIKHHSRRPNFGTDRN